MKLITKLINGKQVQCRLVATKETLLTSSDFLLNRCGAKIAEFKKAKNTTTSVYANKDSAICLYLVDSTTIKGVTTNVWYTVLSNRLLDAELITIDDITIAYSTPITPTIIEPIKPIEITSKPTVVIITPDDVIVENAIPFTDVDICFIPLF